MKIFVVATFTIKRNCAASANKHSRKIAPGYNNICTRDKTAAGNSTFQVEQFFFEKTQKKQEDNRKNASSLGEATSLDYLVVRKSIIALREAIEIMVTLNVLCLSVFFCLFVCLRM